jgi:hypothetical protein
MSGPPVFAYSTRMSWNWRLVLVLIVLLGLGWLLVRTGE